MFSLYILGGFGFLSLFAGFSFFLFFFIFPATSATATAFLLFAFNLCAKLYGLRQFQRCVSFRCACVLVAWFYLVSKYVFVCGWLTGWLFCNLISFLPPASC